MKAILLMYAICVSFYSISAQRGRCGTSLVEPDFTEQKYEIRRGKIVESATNIVFKIMGGNVVRPGTWPWMVAVKRRRRNKGQCGGTLIHKSWVLTAAHCLGPTASAYHVIAGQHTKNVGGELTQTRSISQFWIHEQYTEGKKTHDAALILVNRPFEMTNFIRPACLPEPEYVVPIGTLCVAVGWGGTKDPTWTKELKQAVLRVVTCKNNIYQMCASGREGVKESTCPGDSGGPLLCLEGRRWTVQGIVSYGRGCEGPNLKSGYTRVSRYVNWINQKIQMHTP